MQIHSDAYLNQLVAQEEILLSRNLRAIFTRFSIGITAGTALYTLPEDVMWVQQVKYLGRRIYSADQVDFQNDPWFKPESLQSQSHRPYFFSLVDRGYKTIRFTPTPADTIAEYTGDCYSFSTAQEDAVILNAYHIADPSGNKYRLPPFLLRNVLKFRILEKAYLKEGPGQDLNASKYFAGKAAWITDRIEKVYRQMPKAVLGDNDEQFGFGNKPPRPVLPTSGKWSY